MWNFRLANLLPWLAAVAFVIQWATCAQPKVDVSSIDHDEVNPNLESTNNCLCSHRDSCEDGDECAGVTYGPSRGAFPHGCRWREVFPSNGTDQYEYWDELELIWKQDRPVDCTINVCILLTSDNRPRHANLVWLA